jgi:molybdenum cofactor guanylyltransferase
MGTNKAFVIFDGRDLLSRALDRANSVASDVRIVGDPAKFAAFAPVVPDIFSDCGPLGGIHAALRSSSAELNLILAVDMPFVSTDLLRYLIDRAQGSLATVTVPFSGGCNQPLCAIYRRQFADAAEQALKLGHHKIDALFLTQSTQVINEHELKGKGFSAQMFGNLNTPNELARAHE